MSHPVLGDFTPGEIYLFYDGPLSFSLTHKGRLFFCYLMDQDEESQWFFVRECTPAELRKLTDNQISVRKFLLDGAKSRKLFEAWVSKETLILDPLTRVPPEDLPAEESFLNNQKKEISPP